MQNNASFLAMPEHSCVITRLLEEIKEAGREFRVNPVAYVRDAFKGEPGDSRRKMRLQLSLAVAILVYVMAFVSILVVWSLGHKKTSTAQIDVKTPLVIRLPGYWPKIDVPEGTDKPGGGGGGGRNAFTEASKGDFPIPTLTPLMMAPKPEQQLTPPALPVIEKMLVDPHIQFKDNDLGITGLPDGSSLPSAGQGSGGGMGTGTGGGLGPGNGPGVGQGDGGNTGGHYMKLAVGRPNPAGHQTEVDQRPVLLNQPHPLFTEEARKNKIQGVVRVRILVDSTGVVREVVLKRGLPDGLNEQAIQAAYQMRFKPAMKNGRAVSYWMNNVEVEFNLR